MDSITQAALGGVVGELVLGKKIGWKGMAWGLLFGTIPDLDVLCSPWLSATESLRWHRGVSHSILMMVVASLVLAKPLAHLHREKGVTAQRAGWFVFWAWSTHVLIDVFTSYGTQIFEPFSDMRVSTSNLFIIDLFFTLPLLGCLFYRLGVGLVSSGRCLAWMRRNEGEMEPFEWPVFSRRPAVISISLSSLYVLFSFMMKFWAVDQMKAQMVKAIPGARLVSVAPTPFNTILWRGLIESEEGYHVTYWSPFDDGAASYDLLKKRRELASIFEGQEDFETLKWFSRGDWVARPGPDGKVVFIDLRFGGLRDPEEKQLMPMFQWRLGYDEDGKMEAQSYRPSDIDMKEAFGLILERVGGDRTRWEDVKSY